MIEAGTRCSMIHGLIEYDSNINAIASANGNHTGACKKATTAKPAPMIRATRPPSDGSERRRTKLMGCLLERTYVEGLLAEAGMGVAVTLETRPERARDPVAAVDNFVEVVREGREIPCLKVRRHGAARSDQRLVVGDLEIAEHDRRARLWIRERSQGRRACRLVCRRCTRLPDDADEPSRSKEDQDDQRDYAADPRTLSDLRLWHAHARRQDTWIVAWVVRIG